MASRKRRESFEMALARVIALDELPEKECTKCGEVKSPAAFSADPLMRFGLRSRCKACRTEDMKARQAAYKVRNAAKDPYADTTLKRCPGCGQLLPRTDYQQSRARADGLQSYCRECQAQRCRELREGYRVRNAIKDPHANPTHKRCPDCERTLPRTAYQPNRVASDGLQSICRKCAAQRNREWQLKNPDKVRKAQRAVMRRRRARKRQNGTVPYREEDVFAASDYLCVYCGAPAEEIDHFIPIALGGADAPWNVVATCIACNRGPGGKFARNPFEFFASRGTHIDWVVNERACGAVEELPFETLARTSVSG